MDDTDIVIPVEEDVALQEVEMIQGATAAYIEKGNPKPNRIPVTTKLVLQKYGPTVVTLLISLLGAMYISSVRVGVLMEITQINLIAQYIDSNLGVNIGTAGNPEIIRWAAMAAFECALLSYGLRQGTTLKEPKFGPGAMWMSAIVTVVAGVLAGLTLKNSLPWLSDSLATAFSILSGIGAPVVVVFAAENVGFLIKEIIEMNKVHDEEWKTRIDGWKVGFDQYYPIYANQVYGEERRKTKLHKIIEDENPTPQSNKPKIIKRNVTDEIRQYLLKAGILPSEVGAGPQFRYKPETIADELTLKGTDRSNIHTILLRLKKEESQGAFHQ